MRTLVSAAVLSLAAVSGALAHGAGVPHLHPHSDTTVALVAVAAVVGGLIVAGATALVARRRDRQP